MNLVIQQKKMTLNKNYWENRYNNEKTNWDVGTITTPLKEYIDQLKDRSIKILILGAGNGHEFEYLLNKGFKNSFVIDFAPSPLKNIKNRIPSITDKQLINSDFF